MVKLSKTLRDIRDNNKIKGLIVSDEAGDFKIYLESLHNPTIFEDILKEGWEIVKLPYDFRKGLITLEMLPTELIDFNDLTEEDLQDMEDYKYNLLSEAEIATRLTSPSDFYKFRNSSNTIQTREEFLKFLDEYKRLPLDSYMRYMPLNSFVAESALFSVEEYFDKNNSRYRNLIERRRKISFTDFKKMQDLFVELGLSEGFSYFDLVEYYFSWGICGMHLDMYTWIRAKNYSLIKTNEAIKAEKVYEYITGYIDANHKLYSNKSEGGGRLLPTVSMKKEDLICSAMFKRNNENEIRPILLKRETFEERIAGRGAEVNIEFNNSTILIKTLDKTYNLRALSLMHPVKTHESLRVDCWNLINDTKFMDEVKIKALTELAQNKVKVLTSASSVKALMYLGASHISALKRIIRNSDRWSEMIDESDTNESGDESSEISPKRAAELRDTLIKNVDLFIAGDLAEDDPKYLTISDIVKGVWDGTTNIDWTRTGEVNDGIEVEDDYHIIKGAREFLGLSWEQIKAEVDKLTPENRLLRFSGEGKEIYYELAERNQKKRFYYKDICDYQENIAKTATIVLNCIGALREPAVDGYTARQVAGVFEVIPLQKRNRYGVDVSADSHMEKILNTLADKLTKAVSESSERVRNSATDNIQSLVLQDLFNVAKIGKMLSLTAYGGSEILIQDEALRTYLKDRIRIKCESLQTLCDYAFDSVGRGYWVCVNARITPYFIKPMKGITLEEKPFYTMFKPLGHWSVEDRAKLVARTQIPSLDYRGLGETYDFEPIIPHTTFTENVKEDETNLYNLNRYLRTIEENIDKCKQSGDIMRMPEDEYFDRYPELKQFVETDEVFDISKASKEYSYLHGRTSTFTSESVMERSSFVRYLYSKEDYYSAIETNSITRELSYDIDKVITAQKVSDTGFMLNLDDNLFRIVKVFGTDKIILTDDVTIKHPLTDIPELYNSGKYAITKLTDKHYLIADMNNKIYTVKLV